MLSFANVYFFGSGLINGLRPIQIKNFPFFPRRDMSLSAGPLNAIPCPFGPGATHPIRRTEIYTTGFDFSKAIA
jgi:hypothetical protein